MALNSTDSSDGKEKKYLINKISLTILNFLMANQKDQMAYGIVLVLALKKVSVFSCGKDYVIFNSIYFH